MNFSENQTESSLPIGFGLLIFALFLSAIYVWITFVFPCWGSLPGHKGDDVFYDSIAFNLANHGAFNLDFNDEEWLEVYTQNNDNGQYDWIFAISASGPTTSRAPGFPFMMSLVYRMFPRSFNMVRVLNMFVLAFGLTWLVMCVRFYFGYLAATISAAIMMLDFGVLTQAGHLVSEPLATGLTAITFSLVVSAWNSSVERRRPAWRWAIAGLFFGLTLLVRSNLIAWMLQLGVLVLLAAVVLLILKRSPLRLLQSAFLFFTVLLLVAAPWWSRNCKVSNSFAPFGSAGIIGMVGGYSDEAFENKGNWYAPVVVRSQAKTVQDRDLSEMTLAEQEFVMGQDSVDAALEWLDENWAIVPKLMGMKALNHLAVVEQESQWIAIVNGLILFGAIVGIWGTWRQFGFWIALVTFLSLVTTMVTWSHHGRFAIPIRPIWQVGCALGILYFWSPSFRKSVEVN